MTRTFRALALASPIFYLATGSAQQSQRSLSGTVTDRSHEPLSGAIVLLEDEQTNSVVTFITDRRGQYSFKRIDPAADFHVSATFHGRHSHPRELNHFDAHNPKVINLVVKFSDPANECQP